MQGGVMGSETKCGLKTRTLSHNEVPLIFREPHVFTGYRPMDRPMHYYFYSLFEINNECVNVWTHILGLALCLYKLLWSYLPEMSIYDHHTWPYLGGYTTCATMYLCSIGAHLFHSRSELQHYVAFMVDYMGIGLYGIGSGMQHLYYCGEQHFFDSVKTFYMPVLVLLSLNTCFCSSYFKVKYERPFPRIRKVSQLLSVAIMYIWITMPIFSRVYHCHVSGSAQHCDEALWLHFKQVGCFALAGVFFGSQLPHSIFPGSCDFIFHGHQIFHIFIMFTTFFANEGVFLDLQDKKHLLDYRVPDSLLTVVWPVVAVFLLEVVMIFIIAQMAIKKLNGNGAKQMACEDQQPVKWE